MDCFQRGITVIIKHVNQQIIDVFWDSGWCNWSRFEKKYFGGKLNLALIKGSPMKKHQFKELYVILEYS
jgi:hypothetical protein